MKLPVNTAVFTHQLQQLASNVMNMTTSFVTSTLRDGSKWAKATTNGTAAWMNDKTETMKVSIQNGWQNFIGYTQVLWWWGKVGFGVAVFSLILFGAIYFYFYIRRLFVFIRRRRHG